MMAFEKYEMLGIIVVVQTIVSVRLLDEKLMRGWISGDGRIQRKVFLLDPRGRIGGQGVLVGVVGLILRMPFVVVEDGDVRVVVNGDVDGRVLVRIYEDILEEIVVVRGVDGRAEGGVVLERHCRRTTHHSSFVLGLQIAD
jgi:hypothetical protein